MKLRDVVKLSATMLSLDEILTGDKIFDETFEVTKEYNKVTEGVIKTDEEKTLELMVRCFNLAYQEIATDYLPLVVCEDIEISDGSFDLTKLDNRFFKFVKLINKNSFEEKCEIYDDVLYAKNGTYKIIYCYIPSFAGLNSQLLDFNGKITDRILALGLCKEYCYICDRFNESTAFKTKFEDSLKACFKTKKNIVLPKRRWI